MITATREHEIACGHRVHGHESKCAHLHGHNYLFRFHCTPAAPLTPDGLDALGRVVDFSVIKATLCEWLEREWDHRLLLWTQDPLLHPLRHLDPRVVAVPFNPTAENIARHMVLEIGPRVLPIGVRLIRCDVMETRKCGATYWLDRRAHARATDAK